MTVQYQGDVNKAYGILLSPVLSINSSTDCELLEMVPWMVVDLINFVRIYNMTTKMTKSTAVWLWYQIWNKSPVKKLCYQHRVSSMKTTQSSGNIVCSFSPKKVKTSQIASLRLNFPLLKSRLCSTLLIVKHNIFLDSSFVLVILLPTQSRYNVSSCDQQHQVLINSNKRQSLILILLRSFFF